MIKTAAANADLLFHASVDTQKDVRALAKVIERTSSLCGRSVWDTFQKFLDLALESLQAIVRDNLDWRPDLGSYQRGHEELAKGLGILFWHAYERTYLDIIGEVYEHLGMSDRRNFAQYFTPWNICIFMARMHLADADLSQYSPDRPMKVCDPTCGSGRMLLGLAAVLPRPFIERHCVSFYGMDIDATSVKMARLNLALYGLARCDYAQEGPIK